jgi:PAS domain S-box-containing protein
MPVSPDTPSMPTAHSRSVTAGLRLAIVALLVPVALAVYDVATTGDLHGWIRLIALATAITGAAIALRRQHIVEHLMIAQQRADDALRTSEAKFSGILAIAADAIITIDDRHRIVHFNRGAEELFGYEAGEAIGQPLAILLPERFRATHDAHVEAFGRSAESARRMGHRREVAGRRRDGSEFPAEASILKLDLPEGERIFTVVLRDITERKWAEDAERFLADAGRRFAQSLEHERVLQSIGTPAVPMLADGCIVDVVDGAGSLRRTAHMNDGRGQDVMNELVERFAPTPDSPAAVIDVMRRGLPELIESVDRDWLERTEEHTEAIPRWLELGVKSLYIVPLTVGDRTLGALTLLDLGNQPARFTADARGLAEKFARSAALALENARLYGAAQRATTARDEVLAVVSHDLRNPISAIAMCARILREAAPAEQAERDRMLTAITEATAWTQRLIRDLLDVSAVEAGGFALELRPVVVPPMVAAAVGLVSGEVEQRRVTLRVELPDRLSAVRADESRIVQVISNLLGNAIKFSDVGSDVIVRAAEAPGAVVVSVVDYGVGIEPNAVARIFDRFWQARATPRRGTGLGLAIARGIVEAHGGRLWVESELGRGSVFAFSLPHATPGVAVAPTAGLIGQTRPVSTIA